MMKIISRRNTNLESESEKLNTDPWEVLPANVTVENNIGEGHFGFVMKGLLVKNKYKGRIDYQFREPTPVALKMLKSKLN